VSSLQAAWHRRHTCVSGSVELVRIAGVRLQPPVARLLTEILEGEGYDDTASKISDAIERQTTTEAPLTLADHEAILAALGGDYPPTLGRLRRELLEEQRRLRRITGS
jgi:hypothetical protein